jgi:hypothetical protein
VPPRTGATLANQKQNADASNNNNKTTTQRRKTKKSPHCNIFPSSTIETPQAKPNQTP